MPEILVILVIALIVFGPRKLPELGKTLGKSLAQFRRASEDFKRQWEDEVAIERQRLDAPAPFEHTSYSAADSAASDEVPTSAVQEPSQTPAASDEVSTSAVQEPSQTPAASEATVAAHHDETVAQETKRDWM
jgi:TatA/E family protein of Tat protein translocase